MQMGVKLRALMAELQDRKRNLERVRGDRDTVKKKEATQRGNTASPVFPVTVLTTVTKNREQEVM